MWATIHRYSFRSPPKFRYSNVLWAWATGSMSIKRAPGNILGTSILDFAQFQKSIHKKKGWEGEGGSKWIIKSIILGLNTSIWLFKLNQQKKADCTWFRLLIQLTCSCLSAILIETPEKSLAQHHRRISQPVQWKINTLKLCPSPQFSKCLCICLPSCLWISTLCVQFVFFQLHTIHKFEVIVLQGR